MKRVKTSIDEKESSVKKIVNNFSESSNIRKVVYLFDEEEMCDITVEGKEHSYYANNMLTHNCGEEVCIAANLSSEPVWCNAINSGSDVHMESSKKIFGVADKEKRGIVKTCTFLVIYGGGAYTLAKRLKVAVKEAEEMFSHFYKGMASVARWIKFNTETARRKGIIFTYYGRPRLLYKYYSSSDKKDWSFADRSATNTICQGCLPVSLHIECKNKAIRLSKFFLTKQTFQDGREGILSARRSGICYFIITKSGDFSYAEENHGFIHGSSKHPKYRRVNQGLDVKLLTSKLQSKLLPFSKSFFRLFTKSGRLQAKNTVYNLYVKDEVVKTRHLAANFFICWLIGSKFLIKDIRYACSLRSIASVFGYNLILCKNQDLSEVGTIVEDFSIESESDDVKVQIVSKDDLGEYSVPEYEADEEGIHKLEPRKGLKYKLKWSRKKKVTVSAVRKVRMEPVGSVTMTSGYQMYDAVGFKNKNTGADLMRMLLCKYYQRCEDDPEFKENTRLYFHVHDECNLAVRKQYLFKFFYIWRDLMWVRNKNWLTPLKSDTGIGTTWGNGVNVVGITPENKLIVKGVNDTPELMERTKQAVKAAGLKWDEDLGLDRYKVIK
jgi:hypothetical protein